MEKDRDYAKECLVYIPVVFGAVALFGLICDKVFKSEEKAEEARELGHDI